MIDAKKLKIIFQTHPAEVFFCPRVLKRNEQAEWSPGACSAGPCPSSSRRPGSRGTRVGSSRAGDVSCRRSHNSQRLYGTRTKSSWGFLVLACRVNEPLDQLSGSCRRATHGTRRGRTHGREGSAFFRWENWYSTESGTFFLNTSEVALLPSPQSYLACLFSFLTSFLYFSGICRSLCHLRCHLDYGCNCSLYNQFFFRFSSF